MLRFFSSIRQSLINEGKTVKYLKYAVGEFLLIVAGILVALQIQTWNDGRKLRQERLELIANLKTDVIGNLTELEGIIELGEKKTESLSRFLSIAAGEDSELSVPEIMELAAGTGGFRFTLTLPYYEEAVSTGKLGLLESPSTNGLFLRLNQHSSQMQRLIDLTSEAALIGSRMDLFQRVGSQTILHFRGNRPDYSVPKSYRLTDDEYLEFIAEKNTFATYEQFYTLHRLKLREMRNIKDMAVQILAALEALG